jgi:hypothetical protein
VKQLEFKIAGKLHVAYEGPWRFVLHCVRASREAKPWRAEIYERQGRRTPKYEARFDTRSQAIDWLARYRQPSEKETTT